MNIDLSQIKPTLKKLFASFGGYSVIIIVLVSGVLAAMAINSIGEAVVVDKSQKVYEEELATFKSAVFDEEVIAEVIKLSANDVTIRAILPKDRDNPFLDF